MYKRTLISPNHSFFIWSTCYRKKTWLRHSFPDALWINLFLDKDYLPLLADPSVLRAEVEALEKNSWVVIDEVQKIPALLNEIHDLISRFGNTYKLAMSGSSARKLKRADVNLLAGIGHLGLLFFFDKSFSVFF